MAPQQRSLPSEATSSMTFQRVKRLGAPLALAACCAAGYPLGAAEHWPDLRGPRGDGHSGAASLPLTWSETQNVRWKVPIHGRGWSSPVVWGDQVWLTTATPDGRRMFAVCVDRSTGRTLLDREVFTNADPEDLDLGREGNTYASPSPVIEAGRVYVHFGTYGTACLDTRTFRTLWQRRDMNCRHMVGPGSSPVLFRDRLILTLDGSDTQYLAALDTRTGKTVWKTQRTADRTQVDPADNTPLESQLKAFSTPLVTEWQGKPLLISTGAKASYGYDPVTGRELWKVSYRGFSNASRPVAGHGMAFINTGYHRAELWAVRLGGSGDVTSSHVAWKYARNVPLNPSPLLVDDLLYLQSGSGILTCLEASTGAEVWKERLPGTYTASPLYAAGRLYFFGEDGRCLVLRPGRHFLKVAENRLGEGFMACPAVAGSALILRSKTHLYCIGASNARSPVADSGRPARFDPLRGAGGVGSGASDKSTSTPPLFPGLHTALRRLDEDEAAPFIRGPD
jgi:outer membrane protein assembly factor BamB